VPEPFTSDTSQRNNLGRFSPNGRKLALTRWRPGTSGDIWVADADGRNLTQVTTNPATDNQPNWFPEGDRIAFLSDRNNDHLVLWSISLATGKEEPLLDLGEGVEFAALSPDGKQVAFNSKKSGTFNVWTAPIKDGEAKQLTFDNELMGFPCWSPDGQFLAFEMKRGDDNYLAIMPSGGGQPTQLTFDHGLSWPHSWSPDGDKIVFAGQRDGIWNIYWISRGTKAQKQLTNYSKLNAFVRYPAWSPLGNQIVYEFAETTGNIWLVELR
jgi:TolB protein